MVRSPLATCDPSDVEAEDRHGADDDDARDGVDPVADPRGENDRERSGAEVERKLDRNARDDDVGGSTDGEDDALQRASFRWGASSRLLRLRHGVLPARLGRRTL